MEGITPTAREVATKMLTRSGLANKSRNIKEGVTTPSEDATPKTLIEGILEAASVSKSACISHHTRKSKFIQSPPTGPPVKRNRPMRQSLGDNATPRTMITNFLMEASPETPLEVPLHPAEEKLPDKDDDTGNRTLPYSMQDPVLSSVSELTNKEEIIDHAVEIPGDLEEANEISVKGDLEKYNEKGTRSPGCFLFNTSPEESHVPFTTVEDAKNQSPAPVNAGSHIVPSQGDDISINTSPEESRGFDSIQEKYTDVPFTSMEDAENQSPAPVNAGSHIVPSQGDEISINTSSEESHGFDSIQEKYTDVPFTSVEDAENQSPAPVNAGSHIVPSQGDDISINTSPEESRGFGIQGNYTDVPFTSMEDAENQSPAPVNAGSHIVPSQGDEISINTSLEESLGFNSIQEIYPDAPLAEASSEAPEKSRWRDLVTPHLPIRKENTLSEKQQVVAHIEEENERATKAVKKPPPAKKRNKTKSTPHDTNLPQSLIKSIFQHFSTSRISKNTLRSIEKGSSVFFKQISSDLMAYSKHAGRSTIEIRDVELLMKRQGFITDKQSLNSLIEKYLPLEYRQELIPVVQSGNKVVLKKST